MRGEVPAIGVVGLRPGFFQRLGAIRVAALEPGLGEFPGRRFHRVDEGMLSPGAFLHLLQFPLELALPFGELRQPADMRPRVLLAAQGLLFPDHIFQVPADRFHGFRDGGPAQGHPGAGRVHQAHGLVGELPAGDVPA